MINKIEEVEVEKILLREERRHSTTKIDDGERNFSPKQTMNSCLTRCRTFFENLISGKMKSSKRKPTVCNGNIKEVVQSCSGDAVRSEKGGRKKWVTAMVLLGVTDLIFTLTKFALCSDTEHSTPRLSAGFVEDSSKHDLWLPLCIFTIVGTILFFPELANTLSALFRSDGTTYTPLHLELLVTLIFKHVPLATISYFTSKWWSGQVAGKTGSFVEAAVTSSRLMFVSLRIVWYAHMEGIKVRKNDKYELKQVLFMLCCLLFSITLAVPVMTLKLSKVEEWREPQKKCSDVETLWLTSTWEDSCLSSVDYSDNIAFSDQERWKIRRNHKNGTNADVYLQKCLNISVCDLFNAEGREYLVEYECDHDTLSSDGSSYSNESSFPKLPQICRMGIERFIFRFYYRTFNQIPDSVKKRETSKGENPNANGSTSDEIMFTVEWFCTNLSHECVTFDLGTAERDWNERAASEEHGEEAEKSDYGTRSSVESSMVVVREFKFFKFTSDSADAYLANLSPKYVYHHEVKVSAGCSHFRLDCS